MTFFAPSETRNFFRCHSARLVKHLPKAPLRQNGVLPQAPLGVPGDEHHLDTILEDWSGSLTLDAVCAEQDPNRYSLILSVHTFEAHLPGGSRSYAVPFKTYLSTKSGLLEEQEGRSVYTGFTLSSEGSEHYSFWFYDLAHPYETPRDEVDTQDAQAIWTCFLPRCDVRRSLLRREAEQPYSTVSITVGKRAWHCKTC